MKGNKKLIKNQNKKTENNEESNKSTPVTQKYYSPNLKYFQRLKLRKSRLPLEIYCSIYKTLQSQYSIKTNDYIMIQLENLLESKNTHKVAVFKDDMIMDYKDEFLKREYSLKESIDRIPKFVNYYKNYLRFFCMPTFNDFDINVIIQTHGEKCAEMYYNKNYAHQDKKKKKKKLPNEELKIIFSSTVKDNISDNSMNELSMSKESQIKSIKMYNTNNNNKGKEVIDIKDSTLQFTNLDITLSNQRQNSKSFEDDSIISVVNKMKLKSKNKDTITIPTSYNSIKETRNMTERLSSGNRGSLKKLIDTKCILPPHNNNTLYKLRTNPIHIKNTFSNYLPPSTEINKLNLDMTPIVQKAKKDNNNYIKISVEAKQKKITTRNIPSTLPQTYSNDIARTSGTQIYSINEHKISNNIIQHSNSNVNQQNQAMISSMIYHPNKNNYLSNDLHGRKTMTNIQIKNIKSTSKNPSQSRNRNPITDGLQMPTVSKPVFSSFNYFDKQQQLLNINKKGSGDCLASSTSKGTSSIIKKKNSRFNSDPFKTTDKITIAKGKIKLGIVSSSKNNANIPMTKRNINLPIESLIKLCREKPIMKLGKSKKLYN